MSHRMQILSNGIIERAAYDCQGGTAEPCKVAPQKSNRARAALGRQPIILIGKINQLGGRSGDDVRDSKREHRSEGNCSDKEPKENGFRLPAVRCAAHVKVRSDDAGQLGVVRGKMNGRVSRQNQEQ